MDAVGFTPRVLEGCGRDIMIAVVAGDGEPEVGAAGVVDFV